MKKLILFLLLAGCGSGSSFIDEGLKKNLEIYLDAKETYLGTRIYQRMDIIFRTQEGSDVGACLSMGKYLRIEIDPKYWYETTEGIREVVFAHEMGHCDLFRDHTDKDSLMRKNAIPGYIFYENKEYYLNELFTGE